MLRGVEKAKIKCGHAHFEALGEQVHYGVASDYKSLATQAEEINRKKIEWLVFISLDQSDPDLPQRLPLDKHPKTGRQRL